MTSKQTDAALEASAAELGLQDSVPGGVIAPAPPPAVEPPKSPPSRVFGDAAPAAPSAARDGSPTTGLIRDHPTRPGVATIKAHTEALGS